MVFSVFRPTQTKSEGRSENALYSPTTSPIRSATSSKSWTKSSTSLLGSPLSSTEDLEPDLRELNNDLRALAEIFPNVRPDVFREMLSSLSDESRSHVVADQLLRFGAKWVRGRWRVASNITSSRILCEVFDINSQKVVHSTELVPCEEEFRSLSYKNATRTALKEEFQGISRSAIEGVLVEQNYSYTNSRPILTGLAAKSWRINFKSIMRWKKPTVESHFMLVQSKPVSEQSAATPKLKKTGSAELDEELYRTVLEPLLKGYREHNELSGWELATCLNKEEAALHRATFECECCFDDVAFEFIAFCSTGEHQLCFKCLQNTVSAALYAQAWAKSIDHERSLISCFAPSSEACHGCIPNELAKRAILQTRGGQQTWDKFEEKLAKDAMRASGASFVQCPFCPYAEVDDVCYPSGLPAYKLRRIDDLWHLVTLLMILCWTIPFCWQYFWLSLVLPLPRLRSHLQQAFDSLARKQCLALRFKCRNPGCSQVSCRLCKVVWRDPHKCNEREELSLRTTIEAARSAAMKRVCPKCNLSFVKESGCNKMTCTCGYIMCYLCRQGLGNQVKGAANPQDDHDYSHFCGHFRALPGRCSQCKKCDLYREENQDEIVRRAGETAEKQWRVKMGKSRSKLGSEQVGKPFQERRLRGTLQRLVDYLVETCVTC